jgi:hypothetical protein
MNFLRSQSQDKHNASYFFQNVVTDKRLPSAKLQIFSESEGVLTEEIREFYRK